MAQSCMTFPTSTRVFQVETWSYTTQTQPSDCVQVAAGQTECETINLVIGTPIIYKSQNILYQTSCSESPQSHPVTTAPILPTTTTISPSQTASKSETSGATVGTNVGPIEQTTATNTFITGPIEQTITTNTFITGPTRQNTTANPRAVIIEAVVPTSVGLIIIALLVYFLSRRRKTRRHETRPTPYPRDSVQPAQRVKPPLLSESTLLSATSANFERDARAMIKGQISSSVPPLTARKPESRNAPPPYTP